MCRECSDEDKNQAQKALEAAGVWDKVKSLPLGGDTVLTREFDEEGAGLSGGENQKVSTARLFARKYEMAILDEPSSALDPIAEYNLNKAMIEAANRKTVIFISHRLSTTVVADKIYVMENGEIIESGSHAELMAQNGTYAKMFTLQSEKYKE